MREHLQALVQRFHRLLSISEHDVNTEHMSEKELCEELGKCIGDVEGDYNVKYPIINRAFLYKKYQNGYECMLCKKCFVDKDNIEMHYRFEHRNDGTVRALQ